MNGQSRVKASSRSGTARVGLAWTLVVALLAACAGGPGAGWQSPSASSRSADVPPPPASYTPNPSADATPPSNYPEIAVFIDAGDVTLRLPGNWILSTSVDNALTATGAAEWVTIWTEPSIGYTPDSYRSMVLEAWADTGLDAVRTATETVAGVPALQVIGTVSDEGDDWLFAGEILNHGDFAYVMSWTSLAGDEANDLPRFESIVDSIEFAASGPLPSDRWVAADEPLPLTIPVGVIVTVNESGYAVAGESAETLGNSMRTHTRAVDVDDHEYAPWKWTVNWRHDDVQTGESCRAENVTVSVDIDVAYPEWTPAATAPEDVVSRWLDFATALRVHQGGHTQNAIDRAAEARAAIETRGSLPTCEELTKAIDAAGEAACQRGRDWDADYDSRTVRGAVQGVTWPQG